MTVPLTTLDDQHHGHDKEERADVHKHKRHRRPAEAHGVQSRQNRLKEYERQVNREEDLVEAFGVLVAPLGSRLEDGGVLAADDEPDRNHPHYPENDRDPATDPVDTPRTREERANPPCESRCNLDNPS